MSANSKMTAAQIGVSKKEMKKNGVKRSTGALIMDIIIYVLMTILMIVAVYPLYYCLVASFSDAKQILASTGPLFAPLKPYTMHGYKMAFQNAGVLIGFPLLRGTALFPRFFTSFLFRALLCGELCLLPDLVQNSGLHIWIFCLKKLRKGIRGWVLKLGIFGRKAHRDHGR